MSDAIYRRGDVPTGAVPTRFDPRLIGDIPDDWETVQYILGVLPDPDRPGFPMAYWIPTTIVVADPSGGGYGVNYGGSYG